MLRRRPKLVAVVLLVLILSGTLGALGAMLKREPAFYVQAAPRSDYDTREKASRLLTRVQELKNDIRTKGDWGETFTADELNCFFAEMMGTNGAFAGMLPKRFHSPRVAVEGDRLRLGFRYGTGFWSTVVSVEFRVWLVAEQVNLMAVEVCDLRLGGLGVGGAIDPRRHWRNGAVVEHRRDLVPAQRQPGGPLPLLPGPAPPRLASPDARSPRRHHRHRRQVGARWPDQRAARSTPRGP